tara:strand:- start:792 stop:4388 length:3597 start_codon:yes stop_codon:yes gene_type:complete
LIRIYLLNFFVIINIVIGASIDNTVFTSFVIEDLSSCPSLKSGLTSNILMSFPTPDGKTKDFYMYKSSVIPRELSDKFPSILTYTGVGVESASERVSLTISDSFIKAMILSSEGNVFISNLNQSNQFRVSFHESDLAIENNEFNCGNTISHNNSVLRDFDSCIGENEPCYTMGDKLVTYRIAMIMTTDATNQVADGTVQGGLTWIASMVNQLNLLWRRELGFEFVLIPNQDILVFTNDNLTPDGESGFTYTWETCIQNDGDPKYCELGNVEPYLESVIGVGGLNAPNDTRLWEYGLVLNTIYNGGVAQAPGPISANNPDYAVMNHELGHNLGSAHNITIEGGYRCTLGGTIMGSRTRTSDGGIGDQYSLHTIEMGYKKYNELLNDPLYADSYSYLNGYTSIESNNIIPELNVPNSGFSIPKETPFSLEGSSSPSNPDYLFSWEQNDLSTISYCMDLTGAAGECSGLSPWPSTEGPLFATVDLSQEGYKRYFPSMKSLLDNQYSSTADDYGTILTVEKLPFGSRDINMRLQVRTNELQSSAINFNSVQFSVDGNSGPFRITSQSEPVSWSSESTQTIAWDVSNTDQAPVNCSNVDIYLSQDAGRNFDMLLADNVANDGLENITLPMLANADSCRIMLKASDNIFFDINNAYINITNTQVPDISVSTDNISLELSASSMINSEFTLTNGGQGGSVLVYDIGIIDNIFLSEDFENLPLDNGLSTNEYNLPENWERTSNGRGWIIGTEETSAWPDWLLSQLSDMYFDIPDWSGGNYVYTDDEQYNICPSCTTDCSSINGCADGSMDFLITPSITIPSQSLAELSFDYWFKYAIGNQHTNTLQIFDNEQWVDIEVLNQSSDQFIKQTYNLESFSGNDIKIRFHSESNESGEGLGGGWAIDNVMLSSSPNWISTTSSNGSLIGGQSTTIPLTINTNGFNIGESYSTNIFINDSINNISKEVNLSLCIGEYDECGVCGGGNSPNTGICDCEGTPNGLAQQDCAGTCNGSASIDNCGNCFGGSSGVDACIQDECSEWGGLGVGLNQCCGDDIPAVTDYACVDSDNGAVDPYGDGCAEYNNNPGWCNNYDDDDFISSEMCCVCDGGEMIENIVTPEVLAVGPNGEQQDCAGTCGGCAVEDANGECSDYLACQLVGDLNNDQAVNIVDVISLVNIVLSTSYNSAGDFNQDNVVNIVDIIFLVNIILGQ